MDLRGHFGTGIFLCLTALLLIGIPSVHSISEQDAAIAITTAARALQAAFVNVTSTESSGVNVSTLLNRLNKAGSNLTIAETALNEGDYSESVNQATACEVAADSVAHDAGAMKSDAPSWFSKFLSTSEIGLSVAIVFVVALLLTWLWFKGFYTRKLTKSIP